MTHLLLLPARDGRCPVGLLSPTRSPVIRPWTSVASIAAAAIEITRATIRAHPGLQKTPQASATGPASFPALPVPSGSCWIPCVIFGLVAACSPVAAAPLVAALVTVSTGSAIVSYLRLVQGTIPEPRSTVVWETPKIRLNSAFIPWIVSCLPAGRNAGRACSKIFWEEETPIMAQPLPKKEDYPSSMLESRCRISNQMMRS